jgi:anti-sigma regulatory factor (Ser/Thr protein kinase)
MSGAPDLRLRLSNRAENVALVRQALSSMAAVMRLDDNLLADVKTAVSEACNNVVLHAYGDGEGPLEVYVCPGDRQLTIVVTDQGGGIQPRAPEPDGRMQGVGLSLIQALTERVEFIGGAGEGTEVRMSFASEHELALGRVDSDEAADVPPPAGDVSISVCGVLVGPVLSSVVAVLAARAGFSIERLSDAQLVTDAIAAHAPEWFVGRHVNAAIDTADRRLDLRVGPLVPGGADGLIRASAVGGLDPVLEQLADELSVADDEHEELHLSLSDAR